MYKQHILVEKIQNKRANKKKGILSTIKYFILLRGRKVNLTIDVG